MHLDVSLSQVVSALTSEFPMADILRALAQDFRDVGLPYAGRVADELERTSKVVEAIDFDEERSLSDG